MWVRRTLNCLSICVLTCCALHVAPSAASTDYNRYLAHIFNKYGSGGTMSFEGLEHLMYSLGLGQLEFEPTHTIDEHRPDGYKHQTDNENENKFRAIVVKEASSLKLFDGENGMVPLAAPIAPKDTSIIAQNSNNMDDIPSSQHPDELNVQNKVLMEFKEMHDPKHRHTRENENPFSLPPPTATNVCLSPKSLLRLIIDYDDLHKRKIYRTVAANHEAALNDATQHSHDDEYNDFVNNVQLTPAAFMKLCPALLAQIDQHVCMHAAPLTHGETVKDTLWNAWFYASGSIFVLSCCGLLGILLVPLMKTIAYQEILSFLVAVAVGTLSGDALMHLLPHALEEDHDAAADAVTHDAGTHAHNNRAVWICACAFLTACGMYVLENLLPLLRGANEEGGNHKGHSHAHSHSHHTHGTAAHHHAVAVVVPTAEETTKTAVAANAPVAAAAHKNLDARELNVMLNEQQTDKKSGGSRPLTPVAFMVIIGDGLHNITDGLAIGAAFAADPVTGMATAFAVFCHELPHELGDFALLLQSGVSLSRAVCLNILSSVLSFVGMAVGLLIAGVHSDMTRWIYAATAGSFLYIAFADLLPAMSDGGGGEEKSRTRSLQSNLINITGILVGGAIMLLIAVNEHDLEELFK